MSKQGDLLALIGGFVDGLSTRECQSRLPASWFSGTGTPSKEVQNALTGLKARGLIVQKETEPNSGAWHWYPTQKGAAALAEGAGADSEEKTQSEADTTTATGQPEETGETDTGADTSAPESGVDDSSPTAEETPFDELGEAIEVVEGFPTNPYRLDLPPVPLGAIAKFAALALEAELKHDGPAVEFRETAIPAERFVVGPRPPRIEGITWVWAARTEDGQLFEDVDQAVEHRDRLALDATITAFLNCPASPGLPLESHRALLLSWEAWKGARHG